MHSVLRLQGIFTIKEWFPRTLLYRISVFLLPIFHIFHFHFIQERLIRSDRSILLFYWLLILVEDAECVRNTHMKNILVFQNLYKFVLPYNKLICTHFFHRFRSVYTNITTPSFFVHFSGNLSTRSCIPSIAFAIIIKRIPRIYLTGLHKRERGGKEKFPSKKKKKQKRGRNVSGKFLVFASFSIGFLSND